MQWCSNPNGRLREKLARDKIKTDPDAELHTLRHTFLTEAGEYTDGFYAAVHRRARHHQDHDALCPPSGGVGQPGDRTKESEKSRRSRRSGIGAYAGNGERTAEKACCKPR